MALPPLVGIAKPMPSYCSETIFAELMPMTCPYMLTSGPPELPGLIAASVWMYVMPLELYSPTERFRPETMPPVREPENCSPPGLPMASTSCPMTSSSELPNSAGV